MTRRRLSGGLSLCRQTAVSTRDAATRFSWIPGYYLGLELPFRLCHPSGPCKQGSAALILKRPSTVGNLLLVYLSRARSSLCRVNTCWAGLTWPVMDAPSTCVALSGNLTTALLLGTSLKGPLSTFSFNFILYIPYAVHS